MARGDRLRLALARGQIALGALALRAGVDVGMVEGPPYALGAGPRAEFDETLQRTRNGLIDYPLDVPKHEFLSYLVHQRGCLLHGTASADLDEVRPMVAIDYNARTLEAVFATSDGIWPLFFATLDRSRAGSLWNGCYQIRRGSVIHRYYFFFTEADPRDGAIWRDGAVYVLPREPFGRTWIPNEWVSPQPVRAVGKLSVSPSDFPFKDRVKRFDRTLSLMGNLRRFST
ncbi:MAG: hypothetical protein AABM40_15215 [Chloroflexota bacterium]